MPEKTLDLALATARDWEDTEHTAWTDGSRLENGKVGCSVVLKDVDADGGWGGAAFHLGRNKEVAMRSCTQSMKQSSASPRPLRLHGTDVTQSLPMRKRL
jgi:hypothetical protein